MMPFTKDILISLAQKIKQRNKLPGADWIKVHGEPLKNAVAAHLLCSVEQNPDSREVKFYLMPHDYGIREDGPNVYQKQFLTEQFPDFNIKYINSDQYSRGFNISWQ